MVSLNKLDAAGPCRTNQDSGELVHLLNSGPSVPASLQHRPSCDTFVINRRTRFPSHQDPSPESTTLDLHGAASLTQQNHTRKNTASGFSPVSNRSSGARRFTERYNDAARELGLSELSTSSGDSATKLEIDETISTTRNGFFQRLSRRSSNSSFTAGSSCQGRSSLDDVCRLGGLSLLRLPHKYTATPLLIPACLAATGNFLVQKGKGVAGIFRIPGQTSTINALYMYYSIKMRARDEDFQNVQMTVCTNDLPNDIKADIHDVASTFKRFLRDLPGGILGSVDLFKALNEVSNLPVPSVSPQGEFNSAQKYFVAQLVALRLLSLESESRLALISAVFGLLAHLKQESNISMNSTAMHFSEGMDSHALSVVFAPVLLGDLTELIEIDSSIVSPPKRKLGSPKKKLFHHWRTPRSSRRHDTDCSPAMVASLDRHKSAVKVVEMLIREWESIIMQIRLISPASKTLCPKSLQLDGALSSLVSDNDRRLGRAFRRAQIWPTYSTSLLRSISQPVLGTADSRIQRQTVDYQISGQLEASTVFRSLSEHLQPVVEAADYYGSHSKRTQSPIKAVENPAENAAIIDLNPQKDRACAFTSQTDTASSSASVIVEPQSHSQFARHVSGSSSDANTDVFQCCASLIEMRNSANSTSWSNAGAAETTTTTNMLARCSPPKQDRYWATGSPLHSTANELTQDMLSTSFLLSSNTSFDVVDTSSGYTTLRQNASEQDINGMVSVANQDQTPTQRSPTRQRTPVSVGKSSIKSMSLIPRRVPGVHSSESHDSTPRKTHRSRHGFTSSRLGGEQMHGKHSVEPNTISRITSGTDSPTEFGFTPTRSVKKSSNRCSRSHLKQVERNTGAVEPKRSTFVGKDTSNPFRELSEASYAQGPNPATSGANEELNVVAQIRKLGEVVMAQQEQIIQLRHELHQIRQGRDDSLTKELEEMRKELKHRKTELDNFRTRWYGKGSSESA